MQLCNKGGLTVQSDEMKPSLDTSGNDASQRKVNLLNGYLSVTRKYTDSPEFLEDGSPLVLQWFLLTGKIHRLLTLWGCGPISVVNVTC